MTMASTVFEPLMSAEEYQKAKEELEGKRNIAIKEIQNNIEMQIQNLAKFGIYVTVTERSEETTTAIDTVGATVIPDQIEYETEEIDLDQPPTVEVEVVESYKCKCGKEFNNYNSLRVHKQFSKNPACHKGTRGKVTAKSLPMYGCACGQRFNSPQQLGAHRRHSINRVCRVK